jgi:hypothetical protein
MLKERAKNGKLLIWPLLSLSLDDDVIWQYAEIVRYMVSHDSLSVKGCSNGTTYTIPSVSYFVDFFRSISKSTCVRSFVDSTSFQLDLRTKLCDCDD